MVEQSLKVLEQALNVANKAGVFNLQDSAVVLQALTNVRAVLEKHIDEQTDKPREVKVDAQPAKKAK